MPSELVVADPVASTASIAVFGSVLQVSIAFAGPSASLPQQHFFMKRVLAWRNESRPFVW